jgi:hypothetical protein
MSVSNFTFYHHNTFSLSNLSGLAGIAKEIYNNKMPFLPLPHNFLFAVTRLPRNEFSYLEYQCVITQHALLYMKSMLLHKLQSQQPSWRLFKKERSQ